MRGAWTGFSWGHTQAHFYRAILESVAFEYAYYLGILKDLVPDLQLVEARVVGGGARGATWNQIKADVLGVPYQRLKRSEFGTWGCALIAAKAVGLVDDLAEAAGRATQLDGAPFTPRAEVHTINQPLAANYIHLQEVLSHLSDEK